MGYEYRICFDSDKAQELAFTQISSLSYRRVESSATAIILSDDEVDKIYDIKVERDDSPCLYLLVNNKSSLSAKSLFHLLKNIDSIDLYDEFEEQVPLYDIIS